jgi:hypothetical protein
MLVVEEQEEINSAAIRTIQLGDGGAGNLQCSSIDGSVNSNASYSQTVM